MLLSGYKMVLIYVKYRFGYVDMFTGILGRINCDYDENNEDRESTRDYLFTFGCL